MPSELADHRPLRIPPAPVQQHEEHLRCPRCDSTNTKFCYYNNYNLSQPRHFCKSCRRYWTKGGALRNIPVGGGTRKSAKRSRVSTSPPVSSPSMPLRSSLLSYSDGRSEDPAVDFSFPISFSSLMSSSPPSPGLMAIGGSAFNRCPFELGLAPSMEEEGFDLSRGIWPAADMIDAGGNAWHVAAGGDAGMYTAEEDCYTWPDLAISTAGRGLH